jgi:hypothetical protein
VKEAILTHVEQAYNSNSASAVKLFLALVGLQISARKDDVGAVQEGEEEEVGGEEGGDEEEEEEEDVSSSSSSSSKDEEEEEEEEDVIESSSIIATTNHSKQQQKRKKPDGRHMSIPTRLGGCLMLTLNLEKFFIQKIG